MRRIYLMIAFLMATGILAKGQTKLTLKDCIDTALKNNIGVRQSEILMKNAQLNYKQAKYNRLPNLRRSLNDLGDDVMEEIPETNFNTPASEFETNETRQHLHQAIDSLDANYK